MKERSADNTADSTAALKATPIMEQGNWVSALFSAIDAMDTAKFVAHLTSDCEFRFGNAPQVSGKNNIADYVEGFFSAIAGISHSVTATWSVEGGVVCHGTVSYTRKDNSVLTLPFANVFTSAKAGSAQANISRYLIFADTSELFAAE